MTRRAFLLALTSLALVLLLPAPSHALQRSSSLFGNLEATGQSQRVAPSDSSSKGTSKSKKGEDKETETEGGDAEVCSPPCKEGRGICIDGECFCKHPFTGSTCQLSQGKSLRVQLLVAIVACLLSLVLGVAIALCCAEASSLISQSEGKYTKRDSNKQEVWMPAQEGGRPR
uniref:EGF-like domain-containing protein n=1 Tax=Chromera velia CCMP2878 TaxID=1169474 RepID=A0A0G4HRS0_9ALVE|mmetsp:Transcript_49638/g.97820  ORF Transcript_49638/g.97820 Transcript_49638/m.97820 type:complete len:172 (-) Transcript_49638:304-819(-)|eukprot:Cvel_30720.t1-p1 / transcript=Cvel_30720.t1 / gene=Cvel_30720 / organism=Chromera_velia_CCMP2878 / gene_product=hypothetical protein / transcript_product=hypothetical protein / location=Cvel_scaffold4434:2912-5867(+) / protein_length=171 / sequence_SO=supercontig / SO=protein_coding / is_pseudo=false